MGDGRILLSAYCFFYGSHTVVSSTAGIEPARFDFKSKEFGFAVCTYKFDQLRSKNPPRFELGIEDSKSSVLTTTLWVQKTTLQGMLLSPVDRKIKTKLGCCVIAVW